MEEGGGGRGGTSVATVACGGWGSMGRESWRAAGTRAERHGEGGHGRPEKEVGRPEMEAAPVGGGGVRVGCGTGGDGGGGRVDKVFFFQMAGEVDQVGFGSVRTGFVRDEKVFSMKSCVE